MAAPLTDILHVFRTIFRFLRYAGFVFLGVTLYMIGREVVDLTRMIAEVHPALAILFDLLVAVLVWRCLGVPVVRFLRVPTVLSPPKAPARRQDWTGKDVATRAEFLSRYLRHLRRNPQLAEWSGEIDAAAKAAEALLADLGPDAEPAAAIAALGRFERETVDPILAPLDKEADHLIRQEALAVGISTAISPNGTLDAFLVLWRNANLVSRLANVYYGKPGVRGSLTILRDVSSAALLATYLEGIAEAAGGLLRGVLGSMAGVVAGPLVDGSINALATLRIGHIAKGRCRSFCAWTEATRRQAVADALGAAKARSGEVVSEIAKAAGGAFSGLTGKMGEAVSGFFKKIRHGPDAEPQTE